ncbi:hypothetical protein QTN25_010094 [Entamoeba marina]
MSEAPQNSNSYLPPNFENLPLEDQRKVLQIEILKLQIQYEKQRRQAVDDEINFQKKQIKLYEEKYRVLQKIHEKTKPTESYLVSDVDDDEDDDLTNLINLLDGEVIDLDNKSDHSDSLNKIPSKSEKEIGNSIQFEREDGVEVDERSNHVFRTTNHNGIIKSCETLTKIVVECEGEFNVQFWNLAKSRFIESEWSLPMSGKVILSLEEGNDMVKIQYDDAIIERKVFGCSGYGCGVTFQMGPNTLLSLQCWSKSQM